MTGADNSAGFSLLRRRIDQSEIDLCDQVLAGLGWRPAFQLIMRVDDGEDAVERARVTLSCLMRQAYPDWRLVLIPRYRDIDFGLLTRRLCDGADNVRVLRDRVLDWPDRREGFRDRLLHGFDAIADRVETVTLGGADRLADLAGLLHAGSRPDLVALLRPGDELSSDALAELAVASALSRDTEFLYGDEERLNCASGAVEAFCKPQWSPDLLLSTNYIGRLWCATPALLERIGATLKELLRQGEYDLVLRCTEAARAIRHVPGVLCRRGGDRLDSDATESEALRRALDRRGIAAEILDGCAPGIYRVKRALVGPLRVSIIIATRAARGLVTTCIDTLRRVTAYPDVEIIAIDNIPESDSAAKAWLRAHVDKIVELDPPFNWSRFNNCGAELATGEYLLFLNDDIEIIEPDWLVAMVEHAQRPEVGVVGARLLYPDGTVQHAGMFLAGPAIGRHAFRHKGRDEPGYFGLARTQRNVTAVTGACLLTRRDLFRQVDGFDEAHDIINNDLDYCLKIRSLGLLCVFTPHATLIHHERASRSPTAEHFDRAAFDRQWRGLFARGDPYHHPALSRDVDDLVLDREAVQMVSAGHPLFDPLTIRSILVVKLDHIGDCVGAVPAIRRLKRHFPQARICVMSGPWARSIWSRVDEIDEVIAFDFYRANSSLPHRRLSPVELAELQRRLDPYRFDLAVDLRRDPETRPLLRHTGARYTAGFDFAARFPWLDIAIDWEGDPREVRKRQQFGDSLVNLVDAIAAAGERDRLVLPLDPSEPALSFRDPALQRMFERRVVCVHPAVGNEMRRWPAGYFAQLIDLLIEEDGVNVVVIGSSEDQPIADSVLDQVRHREHVALAIDKISLRDLPLFLARCDLFVGNNSGPQHIAAGIGVPTVGVHSGNVDAREWGPLGPRAVAVRRDMECSPCYFSRRKECPRDLACLTELRPADVYPSCKRMLAISRGRPAGHVPHPVEAAD